ncbi:alpha/beta hydrolase fold domain-containing protein [Fundicoccus sp. Sow4_F4]|uniref:alpha/beta hydrolase fold domain-containing protein n=1 Tax=Fundicoccus sp. Sow4_F4 TaxID=3438783 RepID=UPI003F8EB956
MNIIVRFLLKIISSPKINMREWYKRIRRIQEFFALSVKNRYEFLDWHIYAEDGSHEIPIRVFQPDVKRSNELLLFIHGGGWVLGNVDTYTKDCSKLSNRTGRTVLSVDYSKAPEHPFPAGFNDVYQVTDRLLTDLKTTGLLEGNELTLVGNSAGANLVAAVSLRLRDEGKTIPTKQILINPVTYWAHDERSPFKSVCENATDYGLTAKKMQEYMDMYEPDIGARQSPYVAPLMTQDFSKQPASLIIISEFDPLRDEGLMYGELLEEAGNSVEVFEATQTVHNYIFGPLNHKIVEDSYDLIERFLDNHLKGSDAYDETGSSKPE